MRETKITEAGIVVMTVILAYSVSTIFGTSENWETLAQTAVSGYLGYLARDRLG